jgi:hypothetical protein
MAGYKRHTNAEWRRLMQDATRHGQRIGRNAAEWHTDSIDSKAAAAKFLQMYDDGDPAIEQYAEAPNLSGEYSGDTTPSSLASDLDFDPDEYENGYEILYGEICTKWEEAASEAFWDRLIAYANFVLND